MATYNGADTIDGLEPGGESILFRHDWTDQTEVGPAITNTVADLTDTPPERIGTELRGSVNYDGLERLFQPLADGTLRRGSRVTISIESCVITVESDGWVSVERTAADRG